jgi:hypothetical protein
MLSPAKEILKRVKGNLWEGRKYLQTIQLVKGLIYKNIMNIYSLVAKKSMKTQL